MTVTTETNVALFVGNGIADEFDYAFRVLDSTHLLVEQLSATTGLVTKTYTAGEYTVSGVGTNAGSVTLLAGALSADYHLRVTRTVPYTQELDIVNQGGFYPETVEEQLDLTVMGLQQVGEIAGRALVVPPGETGFTLSQASDRAGKFLAFNAGGEPIETEGMGSDGALRADLAAGTVGKGVELVAYLPPGTDAVSYTAQERFEFEIWANDFGAVGDGLSGSAAANTAAINAAIAYAKTIKGDHGAVIKFGPGDYAHAAGILVDASEIMLDGLGHARLLKTGTTGIGLEIKAPGYPADPNARIYRSGIRGFRLANHAAHATAGTHVYMENVQSGVIENIKFSQYPYKPFNPIKAKRCTNLFVQFIDGSDAAGTGLIFEEVGGLKGGQIVSNVNAGYGAIFDQVTGNHLVDVQCYGNDLGGAIQQNTIGASTISDQSAYWQISAWDMDTNGGANLKLIGLRHSKIVNSWSSTHKVATADLAGIDASGLYTVEIIGHEAINCNGPGILLSDTCIDVHISDATACGNGKVAASTYRTGIVHRGSGSVHSSTAGEHPDLLGQQQYGIDVSSLGAAANILDVVGNRVVGNAVAGIKAPTAINYTGLTIAGNKDGSAETVASAATLATWAAREKYIVTGSTDIYDITPKWDGRRVRLQWDVAATARVVGGTSIYQQLPNQSPGARGWYEAEYSVAAAAWLLTGWSLNDNT